MQLKQATTSAIARLTEDQVPSPRLNAELLLMFTLRVDRAYLFAHPERELTAEEHSRYEAALNERARGVPAQYITGHQEFWGMDLIVTPAVLIPRPETEHVIETVLELAGSSCAGSTRAGSTHAGSTDEGSMRDGAAAERRKTAAHGASRGSAQKTGPAPEGRQKLRIADIGTGSGCIALALAKEFPAAEMYATDLSESALDIARANAARHQLERRIRFHHADLLEGLNLTGLDFVISNPPYVGESEEDQVQLEVRKFEPRNAVFAGPSGTEIIARLIPQALVALRPGGWLILEISGTIADETKRLLNGWDEVSIKPDLQSIPRVAQARKPQR